MHENEMDEEYGQYPAPEYGKTIYGQPDDFSTISDAICHEGFDGLPIKKAEE